MKRPNQFLQEKIVLSYDHAQLTDTATVKLWRAPSDFRVDRVLYINPTGLAADATNFFDLTVMNGAAQIAGWSTETGEEGSIAADTFVVLTAGAAADQKLDAGDVLSLAMTEDGTATLPAGRFVIEGRYL